MKLLFCKTSWILKICYNSPIDSQAELSRIERDYAAVFLGLGLGGTAVLELPGEQNENVVGAVEFIEQLRMRHHQLDVPESVIVIGGGNTAIDAGSEASRMGAENVTIVYRRSKEEMGAYDFEYDYAKLAGAKGLFNTSPIEILGDGEVTGVRFIKTHNVDGKLQAISGSEFDMQCDLVIKATGQAKHANFLNMIDGLQIDKRRKIVVNNNNFQTTNPKYFAGGDAVNGGAEVVNAAYEGKKAAQGIHEWINNK